MRNTGPDRDTVHLVIDRDQGCCVKCGGPVTGERGWGWSVQHRQARQAGGCKQPYINQPSNLLLVCGSGTTGCHGWIEHNRTESEVNGWIVRRGVTLPAEQRVWLTGPYAPDGMWALLDSDGWRTALEMEDA